MPGNYTFILRVIHFIFHLPWVPVKIEELLMNQLSVCPEIYILIGLATNGDDTGPGRIADLRNGKFPP